MRARRHAAWRSWPACLAAGLLVALAAACAPVYDGEPILGPLDTSDPQVALGQVVFAAQCDQCHPNGTRGIGLGIVNKPLPGFVIWAQVRSGLGQMPAFSEAEISDRELAAIIAYVDALRERLLEQRPMGSAAGSGG